MAGGGGGWPGWASARRSRGVLKGSERPEAGLGELPRTSPMQAFHQDAYLLARSRKELSQSSLNSTC